MPSNITSAVLAKIVLGQVKRLFGWEQRLRAELQREPNNLVKQGELAAVEQLIKDQHAMLRAAGITDPGDLAQIANGAV